MSNPQAQLSPRLRGRDKKKRMRGWQRDPKVIKRCHPAMRKLIKEAGGIYQLADQLGVWYPALYGWISGKHVPTPKSRGYAQLEKLLKENSGVTIEKVFSKMQKLKGTQPRFTPSEDGVNRTTVRVAYRLEREEVEALQAIAKAEGFKDWRQVLHEHGDNWRSSTRDQEESI